MKHFGSHVLAVGLKHQRSKTEPRTRTRTFNVTFPSHSQLVGPREWDGAARRRGHL